MNLHDFELVCILGHKCILCFDVGGMNKMKRVGNFASQAVTRSAILTCIIYLGLYIVGPYCPNMHGLNIVISDNSILYTMRQL